MAAEATTTLSHNTHAVLQTKYHQSIHLSNPGQANKAKSGGCTCSMMCSVSCKCIIPQRHPTVVPLPCALSVPMHKTMAHACTPLRAHAARQHKRPSPAVHMHAQAHSRCFWWTNQRDQRANILLLKSAARRRLRHHKPTSLKRGKLQPLQSSDPATSPQNRHADEAAAQLMNCCKHQQLTPPLPARRAQHGLAPK
jgi:hypothetical protein